MPKGEVKNEYKPTAQLQIGTVTEDGTFPKKKHPFVQDLSRFPEVNKGDHVTYKLYNANFDSETEEYTSNEDVMGEKVAVDLEPD